MQYESLELLIQSSEDGTIYNVSGLLSGKTSTSKPINSSAGKCSFSINTNVNKLRFPMGSTVSLRVNNKGKFFGYIFSAEPDGDNVDIVAYNQLRYLKNNESYVLTGTTHEKIIKLIANDFKLRLGTIEGVNYTLPERIEDNKALGDIIQRALDFTLQGTGKLFIIRDEFGYLCCRNTANLLTNIIVGDNSLLKNYKHKEEIDTNTYNSVKLYKDNKDTGKREVYIVKDSNNQKKWGMLQLFQSVDENATTVQIREKANQLLKIHNRIFRTLKLECKGILDLDVGDGIYLQLTDIPGISFNQPVIITNIEDYYENGIHEMTLEVMFE